MSQAPAGSQRLLIAKYLYVRASAILRGGSPFDAGLAVSLFQDALELALFASAAALNAQLSDRAPFLDLWKAVDAAATGSNRLGLPLRLEIEALNKARVNFKHYGERPDRQNVAEHQVNALRVLEFIASSYFALEFASLSLVSFVTEDPERLQLEDALEKLRHGELPSALIACADALRKMRERHEVYYRHGILVAMPSIDHRTKEYIDHQVAHLRSYIRDMEGMVFASLYGVAPMDLLFLRYLLPVRRGAELSFPDGFSKWATDATVERCIDLLAQYSIGMSERQTAIDQMLPGFNPLT